MLGRTKVSLPVCTSRSAPPCRELEPHIELMTQRSSTQAPRCGNSSLTGMPLCPYGRNSQGDFNRLPVGLETMRGFANGSGFPWSRASSGLASNVSTWLGPPCRKTNRTRFARGGNMGGFGASGGEPARMGRPPASAARASSPSSASRARLPKPALPRASISRRESRRLPQGVQCRFTRAPRSCSVDVNELAGGQQRLHEALPGAQPAALGARPPGRPGTLTSGKELTRAPQLRRGGEPAVAGLVEEPDARGIVQLLAPQELRGQLAGLLEDERAVHDEEGLRGDRRRGAVAVDHRRVAEIKG